MLQRPTASPARTALAGAIAMAAAMGFGRFVFTPILPGMVAGVPLSASQAGWIAAANFAGYLAGAILASFGWGAGRERRIGLLALLVSSLALAAMGVTDDVSLLALVRFVAGLASAFAMIFVTAVVSGQAQASGDRTVMPIHFGGVGMGIALSSLIVYLLATLDGGGARAWRADWLACAGVTLAMLAAVARLLPAPVANTAVPPPEPSIAWTRPLSLLTLSYGLFGFGYVITATFIVTMARMGDAGPAIEFLTWFVTGLTAAVSILAWAPLARRAGLRSTYPLALVLQTVGVLASIALPASLAPLVGGALLGATFMVVTAHGLQIGQMVAPESSRRVLAAMTAAFGVGQIVGPLVGGWAADLTGSFALASLLGAGALALATLAVLSVRDSLP
ncbi:YbfB/YjiJ family MFS transporter [Mangrovibrevibacter kandeliae]|uniref:YbfB/YjiJ family MFS transporter n=1 Tax=Mangrovibrevibacter kandeliae TaxID=2968473 RepID=UPI002117AB18|nr:YbfB/YjiJ family MFS transporter [Aurantimonas sp. CSK15Z-1]MCQ8783018.1 MFS transporter [Aurantimonas sp. CSK15Z-1]